MSANQKKLLALEGGGLMGLISLGILARIEAELRHAHGGNPEFRLRDYFDYIGGTSTGAIIAAGLMTGRSVQELQDFYVNQGARMFEPASWWRKLISGYSHRFNSDNLAKLLQHEFTGKTVLELQDEIDEEITLPTDKHLLMVLRNATTDSCWPITTNPAAKYNARDRHNCNRKIPLWQLVRASTAAPFFFQPEHVVFADGSEHAFVDGGLTAHNNPALKLFQMATAPEYSLGWDTGENNLLVVSVGTGSARNPSRKVGRFGAWLGEIVMRTPTDLMHTISVENDLTCRVIGKCVFGPALDSDVGDMTGDKPRERLFTYARFNPDVSAAGLVEMGIAAPRKKLSMEKVDQMDLFSAIGEKAAADVDVQAQFSRFLPQ